MNILPKKYDEFLSKDYWNKFFKKLKKDSELEYFEWYGEYDEFKTLFYQILKKNDKILNIGCGKSLLSEKLYDDGYQNIVNMDFSEPVIKDMAKRSKDKRPKMVYEVMDIFNMKYEPNSFDIIIDKGGLDAIFPEDTKDNCDKINFVFSEISKILKEKGSYICISLLQEHILREVLDHFVKDKCDITIYEVLIKNSKFFPFLLKITKGIDNDKDKDNNNAMIKLSIKGEQILNLNINECIKKIKDLQLMTHFMSDIKRFREGQRITVDIWDHKSKSNVPRYTMHIIDSKESKLLDKKTCGCFITPQGKESGWLFSTESGNIELLTQQYCFFLIRTGLSRLIIAILNPGHKFGNLKDTQNELSPIILDIIPKSVANANIPFMTDGDEIGDRAILYEDDNMIVEEHISDDDLVLRSLLFKYNLMQIQSEAKLKYFSSDDKRKTEKIDPKLQNQTLLTSKKGKIVGIDETYLTFEVHRAMVSGLALLSNEKVQSKDMKALILGGGAGILPNFLTTFFKNFYIESVEISKDIIEVGERFFECKATDKLKFVHEDAMKYVQNQFEKVQKSTRVESSDIKLSLSNEANPNTSTIDSQSSSTVNNQIEESKEEIVLVQNNNNIGNGLARYDLIILDINNFSDYELSPPAEFLSKDFMQKIKIILNECGLLIINILSHKDQLVENCIKELNLTFDIIYAIKLDNELNTIVYIVNHNFKRDNEKVMVELDKIPGKKDLENNFKILIKSLPQKWDTTMNLENYISNIILKHPNINANPFQRTNFHVVINEEQSSNKTKDMYLEDKEKVTKSQRKKKKNKAR